METKEDLLIDLESEISMEHATRWQRLANFIIDYIVYYALSFVAGMLLAIMGMAELLTNKMFAYLVAIVVFVLYYSLAEGTSGRTVGKLITGTKVVKEDGSSVTFGDALKRSLSRLVPFEPFSALGYSPWHDRWTDTYVVKK